MALDHLAAYYFQSLGKDTPESQLIQRHVQNNPDAFPCLLKVVMEVSQLGLGLGLGLRIQLGFGYPRNTPTR